MNVIQMAKYLRDHQTECAVRPCYAEGFMLVFAGADNKVFYLVRGQKEAHVWVPTIDGILADDYQFKVRP